MRGALMDRHTATIKKIVKTGMNITTLYFAVPNFTYKAGQYITVFFDGTSRPEGKAYSLSSAPYQSLCSITVKQVGEFSGLLSSLRPGDTFMCSSAYGHFAPVAQRPLVCLAAGVGIAPVWSVIKSELRAVPNRKITLHYTAVASDAMPHYRAITALASQHTNFTFVPHITRQATVLAGMCTGRVAPGECVQPGAVYLLCGSVSFVRDMWQGLVAQTAGPENISTEVFFEWTDRNC